MPLIRMVTFRSKFQKGERVQIPKDSVGIQGGTISISESWLYFA
jgi:hypothetical protein